MKQSEITQLYVLLNKFRDEYVHTKHAKVIEAFDIVDDTIDHVISVPIKEGNVNLI